MICRYWPESEFLEFFLKLLLLAQICLIIFLLLLFLLHERLLMFRLIEIDIISIIIIKKKLKSKKRIRKKLISHYRFRSLLSDSYHLTLNLKFVRKYNLIGCVCIFFPMWIEEKKNENPLENFDILDRNIHISLCDFDFLNVQACYIDQ